MKSEFTFKQVSEIFAQVYKIEAKSAAYEKAEIEHDNLSNHFDSEFAKLGYSFAGASPEVHELFEAKCKAMETEEKARKALRSAVKIFAGLVGIGENYDDIIADEIKAYIKNDYYHRERVVRNVKYMAKRAAERINY